MAREIGDGRSAEAVADGFIRIAVENMANAIKKISVAKGYDARRYVLNCFGGAGGQHACLVGDALGMTTVFIHPLSGLLSAYGMKLATLRSVRQQAVGKSFDKRQIETLRNLSSDLGGLAALDIAAQGGENIRVETKVHLRYEGSDTTLGIPLSSLAEMTNAFATAHARQFGFGFEGRGLIAESMELEATSSPSPPEPGERAGVRGEVPRKISTPPYPDPLPLEGGKGNVRFFSQGTWHDAPVHRTEDLTSGAMVDGPALLIEPHQTIVVEPGWRAEVRTSRCLVLTRVAERQVAQASSTEADPILLEVFANLFMAIAEEMGVTLQNTATSVNIKERLDFSCAIFDGDGGADRQRAAHAGASGLDGRLRHRRSCASIPRCATATSSSPTRHMTAARICRTSRW